MLKLLSMLAWFVVYLGRLGRADHAPQRVVELARAGQFTVSTNGRVETSQVRQSGCKGQPVQHLQNYKEN
jgi:hypothetical protein